MTSQELPALENDLPESSKRLQMSSRLQRAQNELLEAPVENVNELPKAPRSLQNRFWADSCSEIEGSGGDHPSNAGVKSGWADAPGRVREGLLVSNNTRILRY